MTNETKIFKVNFPSYKDRGLIMGKGWEDINNKR